MKQLFSIITLCLFVLTLQAQKSGSFDGTMVFDISYSGERQEMMNSMAPSSYTYHVRDNKIKFIMEGGMTSAMMGDILIDGDDGNSYMLKDSEEKALRFPQKSEDENSEVNVEKLNETTSIQGYECTKYKVVTSTSEGDVTQMMWVTPELRIDINRDAFQSSTAAGNLAMKKIDGMPLKIESRIPMGNMRMTMTASDIKWEKIDQSEFEIPSHYKVEQFDPEQMKQQMGGGMR